MLSKESKLRVLEGFYGLDYAIFGKPVREVETCCPILKEEYLSVKGALLSVYVEMIKLVDYAPEAIKEKMNSASLLKKARSSARVARENAQKIVVSEKSRNAIKASLKEDLESGQEEDLSKVVESKVREKAFSLAVDHLLLVPVLNESKSYKKLNEWEGRIIEDSYKILRDNLVEGAIQILYDEDDLFTEDEKKSKKATA